MKDTKKKKKKDNWIEHSKPVGYYWYEKVKRIRTGQTEPLFLELRAQQFPKSMKGIKSKIKEAQNPKKKKKRINMKAIIPTHITVKMLKTEDKILNVYCESKTKIRI